MLSSPSPKRGTLLERGSKTPMRWLRALLEEEEREEAVTTLFLSGVLIAERGDDGR